LKLSAAASMVAAAFAGNQDDTRQLADYCYKDTSGYYNSYYATYDWSYTYDDVCPSQYDYYYEKTYTCNGTYGEICESAYYSSSSSSTGYYDSYYGTYTAASTTSTSSTSAGYYDYDYGAYYDNTYGTYSAG